MPNHPLKSFRMPKNERAYALRHERWMFSNPPWVDGWVVRCGSLDVTAAPDLTDARSCTGSGC